MREGMGHKEYFNVIPKMFRNTSGLERAVTARDFFSAYHCGNEKP